MTHSRRILLVTLTLLSIQVTALAGPSSAVGLWKTIDDVTGKPKAVIQITETPTHQLQGTIVKIFPRPGVDENEVCAACKGSLHNQRIVGMKVLHDLVADHDISGRWKGGEILDPHNGKSYHCTLGLSQDSRELNVRGYIGMPLFGRTQTWQRIDKMNG